jgi:hypothetical protein
MQEAVVDAKAVVVVIKECFVIKAVLTPLLFFFLSFSLVSLFLYFLARKKKNEQIRKIISLVSD